MATTSRAKKSSKKKSSGSARNAVAIGRSSSRQNANGKSTGARPSALSLRDAIEMARTMIDAERASRDKALHVFDALPVVELDFMFGKWKGSGINTDHPMDGLLENYAWYGKEFIDADNVHPLLFETGSGKLFIVNPALMPMGLALTQQWLKLPFMRLLFRAFRFLISTKKTKARLRMTELRGKSTATMCYDSLPIHDVFRKVDENTVMGYMDFKHMDDPFFFALRRI